jgi:hypothetical protein
MSAETPLWSIGLFADVQYADRDVSGSCHYREALRHLAETLDHFNALKLEAVINLGDLVDSNETEYLDAVCTVLDTCRHPILHLLGNHDHLGPNNRAMVEQRLGAGTGKVGAGELWQSEGWRLFALDSTEVSVESLPRDGNLWQQAERERSRLKAVGEPCGEFWNGRAGKAQMKNLERCLSEADDRGEKVIVLNHMGAHPEATNPMHLCWNHRALRELLGSHRSAVAHFNGHDHAGGYHHDPEPGVHYMTLPAICDSSGGSGAAAILHGYPDRLEMEGWGRASNRRLPLLKT